MTRLTAFVTIDAPEERADELAALLRRMAEVASRDPGTEVWDASRDVNEPTRFLVYERYTDAAAVRRHTSDVELKELNDEMMTFATVTDLVPARLTAGAEQVRADLGRPGR